MIGETTSSPKAATSRSSTKPVAITLDAMTASRLMEFVAAIIVDDDLSSDVYNEIPEIIKADEPGRLIEPAEVKDAFGKLSHAIDSAVLSQGVSAVQHVRHRARSRGRRGRVGTTAPQWQNRE